MNQITLRSVTLDLLKTADKERIPYHQIKGYCKVAADLYKENQKEEAAGVLHFATRKAVQDRDDIHFQKMLCKIAKVRILISPGIVPSELLDVTSAEKKERMGYETSEMWVLLGSTQVKKLCLIAKRYIQASQMMQANDVLANAVICARREDRTWESLESLCRVAKLQSLSAEKGAKFTLEEAIGRVREIFDSLPRVTMWLNLANLYSPLDLERAREIIGYAANEMKNFNDRCPIAIADINKKIEDALAKLESAPV